MHTGPRYSALYEIEGPDVLVSSAGPGRRTGPLAEPGPALHPQSAARALSGLLATGSCAVAQVSATSADGGKAPAGATTSYGNGGTMTTSFSAIGQPVTQEEGPEKVSGKALYAADLLLPGMLWGKVLRSPYPHAHIRRIDTARARQVPGVHAVLTGQDLPDRRVGRLLRDIPVLARDRVLFVGEKVAAVAAETLQAAEEALTLIDVSYEELPPCLTLKKPCTARPRRCTRRWRPTRDCPSLWPRSITCSPTSWSKGDMAEGFRAAHRIFEHTFRAQLMHQGYIEPHACVVHIDDHGRAQVWANNKGPFMLREQLAAVWDMAKEQINVNPTSIGGDFGGKGSFMDVPLCYYLALHSGRPVKMVMDYIQELMAGNPRHPALITLKTGVTRDGRILAHQVRVVFNSGAYGAFKPGCTSEARTTAAGRTGFPTCTLIATWCIPTTSLAVICARLASRRSPSRWNPIWI